MQAPKTPPRFLPTLTEVVDPAVFAAEGQGGAGSETLQPALVSEDAVVAKVLAQLLPTLEQRIHSALQDSLHSHLNAILPQVMADVREAVRAAVASSVPHSPQ